jgi:hypothetical protein
MMGEAALNPRKERRDLGKNADQAEINLEILGKTLGIQPPCARAGAKAHGTIVESQSFRNI